MKSILLLRFQIILTILVEKKLFVKAGKISVTNCDNVCGIAQPPPDIYEQKGSFKYFNFQFIFL